jgi:hypothetical protein
VILIEEHGQLGVPFFPRHFMHGPPSGDTR